MSQPHTWEPPQPPARKRRRWPWIAGGILLVVIVAASLGGGGDTTEAPAAAPVADQPAAPAAPAEAATPGITYEVTGEQGSSSGLGPGTSVTYTSGENMQLSQNTSVDLPWTETVDLGDNPFQMATLTAQAGDGVTSITCRITEGGEVVAENTSSGQFAVVTCNAS